MSHKLLGKLATTNTLNNNATIGATDKKDIFATKSYIVLYFFITCFTLLCLLICYFIIRCCAKMYRRNSERYDYLNQMRARQEMLLRRNPNNTDNATWYLSSPSTCTAKIIPLLPPPPPLPSPLPRFPDSNFNATTSTFKAAINCHRRDDDDGGGGAATAAATFDGNNIDGAAESTQPQLFNFYDDYVPMMRQAGKATCLLIEDVTSDRATAAITATRFGCCSSSPDLPLCRRLLIALSSLPVVTTSFKCLMHPEEVTLKVLPENHYQSPQNNRPIENSSRGSCGGVAATTTTTEVEKKTTTASTAT